MTPTQKFYGPFEVANVVDLENGMVTVQYSNGKSEKLTKKAFEVGSSDERKDWNYVQEMKMASMMKDIMATIMAHDIQKFEMDAILKSIIANINGRFDRAINYLWNKNDTYNPALNPIDSFSILEAEEVIKTIPKPEAAPAKEAATPENNAAEPSK